MTREKKLKKEIRARARKTGERYAAARRQVLAARTRRAARVTPLPPSEAKPLARRSPGGTLNDAKIRAKTGHGLDHWFGILDAFDSAAKGHTAAARHLAEDHGVAGWYAQGITVEFERARGLRAVNQRMSGFYEVSVSKVLPAPLERVARAIARAAERDAWLRGADPGLRKALSDALSGAGARSVKVRPGKDAHVRYSAAGGKTIEIRALAKPDGRSSVVATVMKIKTAAEKEAQRAAWRRALESLKTHLS